MTGVEQFLPAIRQAVKEAIREEITERLENLEKKVSDIANLKTTIDSHDKRLGEHEHSLDFQGDQIKDILENSIPDLEKKFCDLTEKMCMKMLDMDMHRRKWSVIINGLDGEAGESESVTRDKVKTFAMDKMQVTGADSHPIAACHRLAQKKDAGITVRFVDLNHRNEWLSNAKNLKSSNLNVSLSPDLPPVLRPLKSDILKQRKDLPPALKQKSQVKYHPTWPYVSLAVKGQATKYSKINKDTIMAKFLEL